MKYQAHFKNRWSKLNHPHVRSLAWLLDSPCLLNVSERWTELPPINQKTATWLAELDSNPELLNHYLAVQPQTRLGHYAEKLLAYYFLWRGELLAHSLQVRSASLNKTIGEFDFLLNTPGGLEHWEFACKFYLLVEPESKLSDYVGPNLMDNLQEKSRKIMDEQLALGQHHEAKKYLTEPLSAAKALLKGWLFYASNETEPLEEVTPNHCRGIWCRLSDLKNMNGDSYVMLKRLQWLAPAKVHQSKAISFDQLYTQLTQLFLIDTRPVLVAQLVSDGEYLVEIERIFVVPDGWNLS